MKDIDPKFHGILKIILNYIRFDGSPKAYVRFLTMEDGGGMGEEYLESPEAFKDYYDQPFEYGPPSFKPEVHPKSDVWQAAAKVMAILCHGEINQSHDYLPLLFKKELGRESNIKFNPICRSKQDIWTEKMNSYTGLSKKEYEHLCWLARPRILHQKLEELDHPDNHFYIILYAEWSWMQVLDRIFPNIDYRKTETVKTGKGGRSPVAYRYYFDSKDKILFAYLNINYLNDQRVKDFCEGLLTNRPDLKSRIPKAERG